MNLKKGLYKILYDNSEIEISDEEETQIEELLHQYCQDTLNENDTKKINQIIQEDNNLADEIATYKAILGGVETYFMQKSVANAAQNYHSLKNSVVNENLASKATKGSAYQRHDRQVEAKFSLTVSQDFSKNQNYFVSKKSKPSLTVVSNSKNKRTRRLWIGWSAAAAILLLIVFFVFPIEKNEQLAAIELYQKYSKEQISLTVLGVENESIRLANKAYRVGEYKNAVQYFEQHFKNEIKEPLEAYLCYGISLYRQDETESNKAIKVLNEIMEANNYYSNLARWHLALQYLKADKKVKAKKVLEELLPLTEAGSSRRKDVEDILKSL